MCDVGVVVVAVFCFSGGSLGGTGGGGNRAYSLGGPMYISLSVSHEGPPRMPCGRTLLCVGVKGNVSECEGVCLAGDDDCLSIAGLVPDRLREGS